MKQLKRWVWYFIHGKELLNCPVFEEGQEKTKIEVAKKPFRTDIINYLLSLCHQKTTYLEIGVRDPRDNYNHIIADTKYSVDPGVEFEENPVDFKMTSDGFFEKLNQNQILTSDIKFDVIFIDGLHLADQVDKDIENALNYIKDDGFIVLHDCNPPTEWHARETFEFLKTPAKGRWNGTTWKAFLKWRSNPAVNSCCIDTDWGVGILSKTQPLGKAIKATNLFYEFHDMDKNRKSNMNLMDFDRLKAVLSKN
jgi:hypothetical protein